jgi:hypothetical protein
MTLREVSSVEYTGRAVELESDFVEAMESQGDALRSASSKYVASVLTPLARFFLALGLQRPWRTRSAGLHG